MGLTCCAPLDSCRGVLRTLAWQTAAAVPSSSFLDFSGVKLSAAQAGSACVRVVTACPAVLKHSAVFANISVVAVIANTRLFYNITDRNL